MKISKLLATTAVAFAVSFQANAQPVLEAGCLDALANDTESYSDALLQAFENKADGANEKLGVQFMGLGLGLVCDNVDPDFKSIKDCLNAAAEIEANHMSSKTEYWTDLQQRFLALRDQNICLTPLHNYN